MIYNRGINGENTRSLYSIVVSLIVLHTFYISIIKHREAQIWRKIKHHLSTPSIIEKEVLQIKILSTYFIIIVSIKLENSFGCLGWTFVRNKAARFLYIFHKAPLEPKFSKRVKQQQVLAESYLWS